MNPIFLGCYNHHEDLEIIGQSAIVSDIIEVVYTLNDYKLSKKYTIETAMNPLIIPNHFNEDGVWEFKLYKNNVLLGLYSFENKQKVI